MAGRLVAWFAVAVGLCVGCTQEMATGRATSHVTGRADAAPESSSAVDPETDGGAPSSASPDPGPGPDFHLPSVASGGGPVITSPKIMTITFAGDPLAAQIEAFAAKLPGSAYWKTVTSEYGVGAIATTSAVRVNETPTGTVTDAQIKSWLTNKLTSDARFGAPDTRTLYTLYYPKNVVVEEFGWRTCTDYGGYHSEVNVRGVTVAFAAMARCSADGFTDLDNLTWLATHETVEWATDPFVQAGSAFATVDDDHWIWGVFSRGAEVADLCQNTDLLGVRPPELGGLAQRTWSNAAAKAGHDPCIPAIAGPYFNAFAELPDTVSITDPDTKRVVPTKGVRVGVGVSKTIAVTFASDGPMAEWDLSVVDVGQFGDKTASATASYALDKTRGKNGDVAHLTITGQRTDVGGFLLVSKSGGKIAYWAGLVAN